MAEPRILLFDIETSPIISYNWGIWEQNAIQVQEDWGILCFAYKWLDDKKVTVVARPDFELEYARDPKSDFGLCEVLHGLFSAADIVIAHNGDRFDIPKARARFAANGFEPPAPFQTVDTLKIAKRYFAFTSNRLNDLGETLGLGKKLPTGGFGLWLGCLAGDPKAWKKMGAYNAQDVRLLEAVYLALRPWAESAMPNLALMAQDMTACPRCGAKDSLTKQGKRKYTRVSVFQRFQCRECGAWSQGRLADKTVDKPMAA